MRAIHAPVKLRPAAACDPDGQPERQHVKLGHRQRNHDEAEDGHEGARDEKDSATLGVPKSLFATIGSFLGRLLP